MTLHTLRHGYMHTVLHAHIFVSLFWPTGHFLPNWPFCFSSSQQRHDCGVVASQSVAACGFPRVSFSFRLSSPLFLSHPPPSLLSHSQPSSLFASLLLLLSIFFPANLSLPLSPSLFLSLSGSFSLFPFFFKLRSDWGTVLYASQLLPLTLYHQWWLAAAYHSAWQLLSTGGPGFCII